MPDPESNRTAEPVELRVSSGLRCALLCVLALAWWSFSVWPVLGQNCPNISGAWTVPELRSTNTNIYPDGTREMDVSSAAGEFNVTQNGCTVSFESVDASKLPYLLLRSGTMNGDAIVFPGSANRIFSDTNRFPGIVIYSDELSATVTVSGDALSGHISGAADFFYAGQRSRLLYEGSFAANRQPVGPPPVPPAIAQHPASQTINPGEKTAFSVAATGTAPFEFQWQRLAAGASQWSNLAEGGVYAGSASSTLTVSVMNSSVSGDRFRCVVSNAAGSATSSFAVLTVAAPSGSGLTGSFSATEHWSVTLTYSQWGDQQYSGVQTYSGTQTGTLIVQNGSFVLINQTGFPDAQIGGDRGRFLQSGSAGYSVSGGQVMPYLLAGATLKGALYLSEFLVAIPIVDGEIPTFYGYDAYHSSGATLSSLHASGNMRGSSLLIDVSSTSTIVPAAGLPIFAGNPLDVSIPAGQNATLQAPALGVPSPSLQWQRQASGSSVWANLGETGTYSGVATEVLLVTAVSASMNGDRFRCVASNISGSVITPAALLTVISEPPGITFEPLDQAGAADGTASFAVTASGGAPLSFAWQRKQAGLNNWTDLANDGPYLGVATASLEISRLTLAMSGDQFRCIVTNVAGQIASAAATLSVIAPNQPPAITLQPVSRFLLAGDSAFFAVSASGTPLLFYQWQKNGQDIPGASFPVLGVTNAQLSSSGVYQVRVSNSFGAVFSAPATLGVLTEAFGRSVTNTVPGAFSNEGSQVIADSVLSSQPVEVRHLSWYGYHQTELSASITSLQFRLSFFQDNGGKPEATPVFTQVVNATVQSTGLRVRIPNDAYDGRVLYRYDADLDSSFSVAANLRIWLSIRNISDAYYWLWARSSFLPNDLAYAGANDPWQTAQLGQMAFSLDASTVSSDPVSEDISLAVSLDQGSQPLVVVRTVKGLSVEVQASTNLQTWETIGILTNALGLSTVVQGAGTSSYSRRFYRAREFITSLLFNNGLSSGTQPRTANDEEQRVYDDFSLRTKSTIMGISWQQHDDAKMEYLGTRVRIYAGLPEISALVFSGDFSAVRTPNSTGTIYGSFEGVDYSIASLSIFLPQGTYYLGLSTLYVQDGISAGGGWDNTLGTSDTMSGARLINSVNPAPGRLMPDFAFQIVGIPTP